RLQRAPGKLLLGVHAQHEDGKLRLNPFEVAQDIDSAAAGHTNVQDGERPLFFRGHLERLLRRLRFGERYLAERARQKLLQPRSNHGVIVSDDNLIHTASFQSGRLGPARAKTHPALDGLRGSPVLWRSATGTRTVTAVPCPGEPLILNSPPSSSARSRMPRSPREL